MVEGKPRDLRYSLGADPGTFHHIAVFIKIHISIQIFHISRQCFFIYSDLDRVGCQNRYIHHIHKGNVLNPSVPVFQRQIQGIISQRSRHHDLHDLVLGIMHIALHIHGTYRIHGVQCHRTTAQCQQQDAYDHYSSDNFASVSIH